MKLRFFFIFRFGIIVGIFVFCQGASLQQQQNQRDDKKSLINDINATNGNQTIATVGVECDNAKQLVDECFKDLPPHLMEFLQTTKIAINEEEISSKCDVFHRGMKCFDQYTLRCLSHKKFAILQNNIEGARRFFTKFCSDPKFQSDYLEHKDCLSHIQDDWKICSKDFQHILTEELHSKTTNETNKFMEFCCARHAYENCIFNSARYKCFKSSVKFARETARELSDEKHFSNCRQYQDAICNAATALWGGNGRWLTLLAPLALLLSLMLLTQLLVA